MIIELVLYELRTKGESIHLVDLEEMIPILDAVIANFPKYRFSASSKNGKCLVIIYLPKE